MKKKIRAIISIFIICIFTFSDFSIATKGTLKAVRKETVYVTLDDYGKISSATMYVDTLLNGNKIVKDYGTYNKYENLTNRVEATKNDDGSIAWDLTSQKNLEAFEYNAVLSEDTYVNIPWTFDISYKLNGVDINPESLPHESGMVDITIDIKPNDKANDYYKNNYMLEITSDFDMNDYLSVTSEDAIEMITGKTKTLMWIVLPGSDETYELRLGTEDFQYDGLTFAMVPISGKLSDEIMDLINRKQILEDAYNSSMNSTDVVLDGLKSMSSSLSEVSDGISSLRSGMISMHSLQGKRDMSIDELKLRIEALENEMETSRSHIENSKVKVTDLFEFVKSANKQIDDMEVELKNLSGDLNDIEETIDELPDQLKEVKDLLDTIYTLLDDSRGILKLYMSSSSIDTSSIERNLRSAANSLGEIGDLVTIVAADDPTTAVAIGDEVQSAAESLRALETNLNTLATSISNNQRNFLGYVDDDLRIMGKDIDSLNDVITKLQDDAPIFEETLKDSRYLVDTLRKLVITMGDYSKKVEGYEGDIQDALTNLNSLINILQETLNTSTTMITTIEDGLDIVSGELYRGALKTTDGLQNTTQDILGIVNQTNTFMDAKQKIDVAIRDKWDEIDNETNLFKMNKDVDVLSFSSSKNDNTDSVQILLKTGEIKEIVDKDMIDYESEGIGSSIWEKIGMLFKQIWDWIVNLFK